MLHRQQRRGIRKGQGGTHHVAINRSLSPTSRPGPSRDISDVAQSRFCYDADPKSLYLYSSRKTSFEIGSMLSRPHPIPSKARSRGMADQELRHLPLLIVGSILCFYQTPSSTYAGISPRPPRITSSTLPST
jgi:hypothetical protein